MHGRGVCMARGHAWQGGGVVGACVVGVCVVGACVVGDVWQREADLCGRREIPTEMHSCSFF